MTNVFLFFFLVTKSTIFCENTNLYITLSSFKVAISHKILIIFLVVHVKALSYDFNHERGGHELWCVLCKGSGRLRHASTLCKHSTMNFRCMPVALFLQCSPQTCAHSLVWWITPAMLNNKNMLHKESLAFRNTAGKGSGGSVIYYVLKNINVNNYDIHYVQKLGVGKIGYEVFEGSKS